MLRGGFGQQSVVSGGWVRSGVSFAALLSLVTNPPAHLFRWRCAEREYIWGAVTGSATLRPRTNSVPVTISFTIRL